MNTSNTLSKQYQLWEDNHPEKGYGPGALHLALETSSLYQAMMYFNYPNQVKSIRVIERNQSPVEITHDELVKLAFFDLIGVKTVMERSLADSKNDGLYLVVGKMQEITPKMRSDGIHFSFHDILGWTNSIKDARDLFKQGKVGSAMLMKDSSAPAGYRLLTGQQIIDLHAYEECRPLSFDKRKELIPGQIVSMTPAAEVVHVNIPTPIGENVSGEFVIIHTPFIKELVRVNASGMTRKQAENAFLLMFGSFNLVEDQVNKITGICQGRVLEAIQNLRNEWSNRKEEVVSILMTPQMGGFSG